MIIIILHLGYKVAEMQSEEQILVEEVSQRLFPQYEQGQEGSEHHYNPGPAWKCFMIKI